MPVTKQRTLDYMEQELGTYVDRFYHLPETEQKRRVIGNGYDSLRDLLVHVLAWWEKGLGTINNILNIPGITWTEPDTDQFNQEVVKKYSSWSESDLLKHYDIVQLAMIDLVAGLPDDTFQNREIESWLAEDVVEHYDEHALA